jgi:hypothetical protein
MRLAYPLPKAVTERSRIFERAREGTWSKEQTLVYAERLAHGVDPIWEEKGWELSQQRAFVAWQLHAENLALKDVEMGEGDSLVAESTPRPPLYTKSRVDEANAAGEGAMKAVELSESQSSIHEWIERMGRRQQAKDRARVGEEHVTGINRGAGATKRIGARRRAREGARAEEEVDILSRARKAASFLVVTKLQAAARKPSKTFVKALGLVMDRPPKAKSNTSSRIRFLSTNAQELYTTTERGIVNKHAKHPSKVFWKMLREDDNLLRKEVDDMLHRPGVGYHGGYFGPEIWSEKYDFLLVEPDAPDDPDVPISKLRWDEHEDLYVIMYLVHRTFG